ncbi:MAG: hypothetical protein LBD61_02445 [Endomicrobium sp.]|jgi:hypothetical protein|nr:hypothetical protein [Endomicrobium sp.]
MKRTIKLTVHVNNEEYKQIKYRTKQVNLSVSTYLRNLALSYPIKSKVDALAYLELARARADTGRLGGLFKLWLTEKDFKSAEYKNIDELVGTIINAENKLVTLANLMIRNVR